MKTKICLVCGKEFESGRGAKKFCSDECFRKHRREYNRLYEENRRQERALKEAPVTSEHTGVDEKLRACHEAGQTYAEAQKAETIEKFARVEVPEAFMMQTVETPERPARRKKMYLSSEEREALIRIEAQAETLQAFFRSIDGDKLDYPGVVLGRILEQIKTLLEANA